MQSFKESLKKVYHFIFHDDSLLSWLVNFVLAFLVVKFLVYPGLAFLLGTPLPLVAVISGSMEHEGVAFDQWWVENGQWYEDRNITKTLFSDYRFSDGFDKGDVMILVGVTPEEVKQGDVLVYTSSSHPYPIIHRVTYINQDTISGLSYQIKGDNNDAPDPLPVERSQVVGKALYRIPKIGWIKIWFAELFGV